MPPPPGSAATHLSDSVPRPRLSVARGLILMPLSASTCLPVKASRGVQVSETTETSARLRWEKPEPPAPYSYDLTVTSAHDQAPVLKLNLTATEHVARGLRPGHTYHVVVVCHLRAQVRATYQGSFSTSEYAVGPRRVAARPARGEEGTVPPRLLCSGGGVRLGQNPGRFACSQRHHE